MEPMATTGTAKHDAMTSVLPKNGPASGRAGPAVVRKYESQNPRPRHDSAHDEFRLTVAGSSVVDKFSATSGALPRQLHGGRDRTDRDEHARPQHEHADVTPSCRPFHGHHEDQQRQQRKAGVDEARQVERAHDEHGKRESGGPAPAPAAALAKAFGQRDEQPRRDRVVQEQARRQQELRGVRAEHVHECREHVFESDLRSEQAEHRDHAEPRREQIHRVQAPFRGRRVQAERRHARQGPGDDRREVRRRLPETAEAVPQPLVASQVLRCSPSSARSASRRCTSPASSAACCRS